LPLARRGVKMRFPGCVMFAEIKKIPLNQLYKPLSFSNKECVTDHKKLNWRMLYIIKLKILKEIKSSTEYQNE